MFDFLNRFGLPVKYAVIGLLGGVLGLTIAFLIGYRIEAPWASLLGIALGGAIGGYIRQRRGRTK